jgi:hypothetical protein
MTDKRVQSQGFSKLGHRQSQGIRWHGGEVL